MTKTYLVTGGAGFIGSNFVSLLLKQKGDIRVINVDALTYAGNMDNLESVLGDKRHAFIKADICDKSAISEVFQKCDIDYVVNFAAESHVDRSIRSPEVFVSTNICGTANLLQCAMDAWDVGDGRFKAGVRFLQVSTDEVYGTLPLEDSSVLFREETPLDPHSPYSASKASADLLVKAFGDTFGLPVNITRCSNNYGPNQFPEKLIPLMIDNAVNHDELPVYGDGLNVRDWLYVEDHCRAIDLVLSSGRAGEIYNIGGNNERANIAIVKTIIAECSKICADPLISERLITFVADRKGHDRRYGIDSSKIQKELGWKPKVAFEEGIKETIRWYLEHRDWVERIKDGSYRAAFVGMMSK